MKLLLILLCAVTYHYCNGYPVNGEFKPSSHETVYTLAEKKIPTPRKNYCRVMKFGQCICLGEISEEILTGNDTSVEHLLGTTNHTSSNDSLPQHGFFKKVGGGIKGGIKSIKTKIGNLKNKIGSFKDNSGSGKSIIGGGHHIGRIRTNSGSGVKDPENAKWALLGIGLILLVTFGGLTWYSCQKKKRKRDTKCEVQQVNKM